MSRLLAVANESPWPVHNGGRARMAGLLGALAADHDVLVAAAGAGPREPGPLPVVPLPGAGRSRAAAVLGPHPRLGAGLIGAAAVERIVELRAEHRPDAVLVTHSYLLPMLPDLGVPLVLDLPNLEVARSRSAVRAGPAGRRAVAVLEHLKARRWEPAAVRRADLCLAVDERDARTARGWGARDVLVVPNASDATALPPSPDDGVVLAVADWRYDDNRRALGPLLERVWPAVRRALPDARLLLVGRGAPSTLPPGAAAAGFVDDLADCYSGASVVLAPATSGGGTQVKVAEAVAHARVVVCPPYGGASVPAHAREACVVTDDLPGALVRLLSDHDDRHRRERLLQRGGSSWAAAAAPLGHWLAQAVSRA